MHLRLDSLCKRFASPSGRMAGVNNLNLSIEKSEGFSLLGPSGCGKTTTLRLLGGFEKPDSGKIWLGDRDITQATPQSRPIRTVFQRYALFPHLSVWENVVFSLKMRKASSQEIKTKGEAISALIEIEPLLKRPVVKLSGGEQQRVALARALIAEPEVLLLDEPFSALDLKLRERLQLELLSLKRKLGTTFIFVTHDQTEALLLSDRIAVMRDGKLEQVATPEELYARPVSKFVASFIGQANFIAGDAELQGKEQLPHLPNGSEWMVRAERLRLEARGYQRKAGEATLPVRVKDQVFRGQERLFRVEDTRGIGLLVIRPGYEETKLASPEAQLVWEAKDTWFVGASS